MKLALMLPGTLPGRSGDAASLPRRKVALLFLVSEKNTQRLLGMLNNAIYCTIEDDGSFTPDPEPFVNGDDVRLVGTNDRRFAKIIKWGDEQDANAAARKLRHTVEGLTQVQAAVKLAEGLKKQIEDPQG